MSTAHLKPADTLKAMETFYSRKYGLANFAAIDSHLNGLNVPGANHNYMVGNIIPRFTSIISSSRKEESRDGCGVSLDRDKSKIKAFGEFIERYCATYNEGEYMNNTLYCSYKDLVEKGLLALDLDSLIPFEDHVYDEPGFPYSKYTSRNPILWVKGKELICGQSTWLPAQKVLQSYPLCKEELRYHVSVSTGLACGHSIHHATLNAMFEIVERDSFMLTWLLKIPGVNIVIDSIKNEELRFIYNHINKHLVGEDCMFVYDISKTDGIYTILTFIRNDLPNAYGLIVSAASHTDPEKALLKSLEELCQMQSFCYSNLIMDEQRECMRMEKHDINDLRKHALYYSSSLNNRNIDFISSTGARVSLSGMEDYTKNHYENNFEGTLEYVTQLLSNNNQMAYVADLTKPEIHRFGFRVVRVIMPDYVDLTFAYKLRHQKSNRLLRFQEMYGREINDDPHPFA